VSHDKISPWSVLKKTLSEIRSALTNQSFRWLFSGVLIVFAMVGVDNALNLHMNTYFWELQGQGNLYFFAATPVGALLGTAFASTFTRWFDKKPSVIIGTLCWALCQVIPVVLRLLGWFPENGTDELLVTLIVIKFVQGFGVVQALIAFNSMVADVVDEHELITGLRQEGIFFSSVSFSNKMTSGIGTVAAGFALALIDWPTGADVQTAADIGAETIAWLGLIYGPIVSGFALVCVTVTPNTVLTVNGTRRSLQSLLYCELNAHNPRVNASLRDLAKSQLILSRIDGWHAPPKRLKRIFDERNCACWRIGYAPAPDHPGHLQADAAGLR
jgi:Na+/melibiose symporter-like transporter